MLVLAGNHDHGLVAGWIDARLQSEPSGFLGLSEPVEPGEAGPLAERLAELARARAAAARLPRRLAARRRLRDPRPLRRPALDGADVRAPRRRRDGPLGRAAARGGRAARTTTRRRSRRSTRSCTSSPSAPTTPRSSAGAGASARAWVALAGEGRAQHPVRAAALGSGYVAAVAALNALGPGTGRPRPVRRRAAPRRPARDPRGPAPARRRRRRTCIFGHTHRVGPVAAGRPGRVAHARRARGSTTPARGSTSRTSSSERPNASPYWPGTAVLVEDGGPAAAHPAAGRRVGHAELRPPA